MSLTLYSCNQRSLKHSTPRRTGDERRDKAVWSSGRPNFWVSSCVFRVSCFGFSSFETRGWGRLPPSSLERKPDRRVSTLEAKSRRGQDAFPNSFLPAGILILHDLGKFLLYEDAARWQITAPGSSVGSPFTSARLARGVYNSYLD